ncbi:MAG: hypothetical protein QF886_03625 [Planctomycetota bacterium]|jgi:hypothetical protein|nr:hypothetical protein [Planctomycetota bacterium]
MNRATIAFLLTALASVNLSARAFAAEGITLKGPYTNQGQKRHLKGEFTPTAKGKWKVTWWFNAGRRGPKVFKGTAEGNLKTGELKGKVIERRVFTFEGSWNKNQFSGTTAEYFKPGGKPSPTGTIELSLGK